MVEVVALIMICHSNLLICEQLPFDYKKHAFENMDDCKKQIRVMMHKEKQNHPDAAIMGKCEFHLNEN